MSNQIDIVKKTMQGAFASSITADKFLSNPAVAFSHSGYSIPQGDEEGFNKYFNEVAGVARLKGTSENQLKEVLASWDGCTWCNIGAYAVALAIVAVGVAGLASLAPEAAAVGALAGLAGVDAGVALAFIRGMAAEISLGVGSVANRICQWMGSCG
jgi:hypothetical protein